MVYDDMDKEIQDLCDQLEINKDNIQYVCLVNNVEFVGEILNLDDSFPLDDEELLISDDYIDNVLFLHPQKVNTHGTIDEDGIIGFNVYFSDFNPYSQDPCLYLENSKILYIMTPVKEMILEYLRSVKESYFPTQQVIEVPVKTKKEKAVLRKLKKEIGKYVEKENARKIVDFGKYHNKRKLGEF